MELFTKNSSALLERIIKEKTGILLQEFSAYDFKRYESPKLEIKRAEVSNYRLAKPSTIPWYNPQRILRHFR